MKTCQSTGYFQQVPVILLLCVVSLFVFAPSARALTGNVIDQCYDCHGSAGDIRPLDTGNTNPAYRNITTGAIKGSHRTHVRDLPATTLISTCTPCHGPVPDLPAGADHRNGLIDMNPAVSYTKSPFFNQTSVPQLGTCSAASCHANPYGTGSVTTPTWGTALPSGSCAACHNNTSGTAAAFDPTNGAPTTGAHTTHMGTVAASCSQCHANVSKDSNPSSNLLHNNGMIDVTGYPAPIPKHPIDTPVTSTCTTTLCHGSNSPQWADATLKSVDTCTKCHGTPTVQLALKNNEYKIAPPTSISGAAGTVTNNVSNNPKVGAHQAHLNPAVNGFSNYSTILFNCSNCHGALPILGNHASGSAAAVPNFTLGMANRNGKAGSWNAATLTCSNTYCHNPAGATNGINAANAGTGIFVSWTSSKYLIGMTKNEANCNRCHKSPGAVAGAITIAGTDHSSYTIVDDCSQCHGHNGNQMPGFVGKPGSRHMDGILYGNATRCNGCHSYDAADWAGATHNYGKTTANEGIGAHAKHITYIKQRWGISLDPAADYAAGFGAGNAGAVCGVCHSNALADHTPTNSANSRNINFNGSVARQFGSVSDTTKWYTGTFNSSSAANAKKCSNIDCHYGQTPFWSTY